LISIIVGQGSPKYDPRARSDPRSRFIRWAKTFDQ